MKTLLAGLGNPILGDDAIGVRLAADFKAACGGAVACDWEEECVIGGLHLLDLFRGYQRVLVLDSLLTREGRPGDWHYFTAHAFRHTVHLNNLHDANFATALALGRRLGVPLPPDDEIHIFAVEITENRIFDERLSPPLARAYPALKTALFAALRRLLVPQAPLARRQPPPALTPANG